MCVCERASRMGQTPNHAWISMISVTPRIHQCWVMLNVAKLTDLGFSIVRIPTECITVVYSRVAFLSIQGCWSCWALHGLGKGHNSKQNLAKMCSKGRYFLSPKDPKAWTGHYGHQSWSTWHAKAFLNLNVPVLRLFFDGAAWELTHGTSWKRCAHQAWRCRSLLKRRHAEMPWHAHVSLQSIKWLVAYGFMMVCAFMAWTENSTAPVEHALQMMKQCDLLGTLLVMVGCFCVPSMALTSATGPSGTSERSHGFSGRGCAQPTTQHGAMQSAGPGRLAAGPEQNTDV